MNCLLLKIFALYCSRSRIDFQFFYLIFSRCRGELSTRPQIRSSSFPQGQRSKTLQRSISCPASLASLFTFSSCSKLKCDNLNFLNQQQQKLPEIVLLLNCLKTVKKGTLFKVDLQSWRPSSVFLLFLCLTSLQQWLRIP